MTGETIINDQTKFDLKFNNLWAILAALAIVIGSWYNLSIRLELIVQKADIIAKTVEEIKQSEIRKTAALNEVEKRLATLEGMHSGGSSANLK